MSLARFLSFWAALTLGLRSASSIMSLAGSESAESG
jgi:hypothetical protein